jgi:23S rRNA pseudouridine2605 synthase
LPRSCWFGLELDGIAVRLNLLGQPGEQPDFVVAAWVLPYVYALRGDRDWRRTPQLTGSRQVSPLAIQAYKLLETGEQTIPQLKHALGKEVSESAVLRAITELWQQLRIIPVLSAPGVHAKWQLLRLRFQKAIAEGASPRRLQRSQYLPQSTCRL